MFMVVSALVWLGVWRRIIFVGSVGGADGGRCCERKEDLLSRFNINSLVG